MLQLACCADPRAGLGKARQSWAALQHQQFATAPPADRTAEPYLLGPSFTAADILLVHCLNWAEAIGWLDLSLFKPETDV